MSDPENDTNSDDKDASAIVLPVDCRLGGSEELLDMLSDSKSQKDIVLDASEVERMSAACALTVVSAVKHCEAMSGKLAVIKPTPVFVDAFSELGLFQELMKMEFRQ